MRAGFFTTLLTSYVLKAARYKVAHLVNHFMGLADKCLLFIFNF